MSYLLDTNACIAIINGRPSAVRDRLRRVFAQGNAVAVSTITLFELWYGVSKSGRPESNAERLEIFMAKLDLLAFDEQDAEMAGLIRTKLERSGTPIGAYDLLIAGQAACRNLTLVTANVAEFERVAGLHWENWSE